MSNYFYTHDSDVTLSPRRKSLTGLRGGTRAELKAAAKDGDAETRRASVTTFNQQQAVTQQTISVLLATAELLL